VPEPPLGLLAAATALAAFVAGFLRGSVGGGVGLVLTPILSLVLPAGLYVLTVNLERLAGGFADSVQLSLFLRPDTAERTALELAGNLRKDPALASVEYVSRQAGLAEFRRQSGFDEALDALGENPLPPVLILRPRTTASDPGTLERLAARVRAIQEVEFVQFDLDWVRRLQALLALAERGFILLAGLLGLGVLLVIAQTSRAAVEGRRTEIEVMKLVGATNAFIRRPFLYAGVLHGLAGAVLAWALLALALALLAAPVETLAAQYGGGFRLQGLGPDGGGGLIVLGGLLGWIGARVAVIAPIGHIEPA